MSLPAYAIAYLREIQFGDQIARYMRCIDATLEPFGGQFLIHGGALSPQEGEWDGDIVVIAFPDRESALAWYASPAYQAILPLRTDNSTGIVTIVDGVAPGHRGADKLRELLDQPV
ncbi:DUF1330 domain-containing protein [Ornithinimicrobium faecis]|uniref:DUF1330 domain-containing protein n=1 Tax=Ornithinimicrobium faecis TaxID=2934158 RepID=UPI0021194739|nr:DUF1330 domain-containing protein [Ornithinimicrobium sp. HY1745]